MTVRFSEAWLIRLNNLVKVFRRQHAYSDVYAVVDPPRQPGNPPLLRLEMQGTVDVVPLTLPAVDSLMRTGREGPLLIEIKQAFVRVTKTAERRRRGRPRTPPRKSFL